MAKIPHVIKLPSNRRRYLLAVLIAGFLVLIGRAFYLQSLNKDFYQRQGSARYMRSMVLNANRGLITDRNGESLAMSTPVETICANPADATITTVQINKLAGILHVKVEDLKKKLGDRTKGFVYLKRRISPEDANKIMSLGINGVFTQREYRRYYPDAEVAAHLVGFTGLDEKGQEGLELKFQDWLAGKPGKRNVIRDRQGHIVDNLEEVKIPQEGHKLVLSIDRKIQYLAYRELSKAVEANSATAGAAVVLDAKTGEVLAMVNLPSYNPNNPNNIQGKTRNRAITDTYEPGSIMKPMTVAIGMESGKYNTTSTLNTAPGTYKIGPATIHDHENYGVMTLAQIIQKSSNVGASKIALSLDKQYMWSMLGQLGFGEKTGIEYPGEVSGKLRDYKTWRPIEQATMSYGNGISVTLLQMARAYTVFANGGELLPVTLMKLKKPQVGQQIFSAETANAVREMLELVVQPGGTALKAQIMGYRVAGKTGTAHKPGVGGYQDKYIASFVGIAPASNPKYIVAVMVDEPSAGRYYGGDVAAPVFSAVMGATLRMMGVPQDAPNKNVMTPSNQTPEVREIL
jgi:cell division protein FtsI (penicillin-binding protein 3)